MNIKKRVDKPNLVRKNGFVPGVLYGKGIESIKIQIEESEFNKLLRENGTNKTFSVKLGKKKHIVYIKKFTKDVFNSKKTVHFDLLKVSQDDKITSNVQLHFVGREGFEKSSLIFVSNKDEAEIEYNVGSGISKIDVDITGLTEGNPIYFKDLVVPEGIKVLNDPEELVCGLTTVSEEPKESEESTQEIDVDEEGTKTDEA